jgi:adenine-specific DNA-methyltransferase
MTATEQRAEIQEALHTFSKQPLRDAAIHLWQILGYRSNRTLRFDSKEEFLEHFTRDHDLNTDRALYSEWEDTQFLFQLTDNELGAVGTDQLTFSGQGKFEGASYESFLFLAIRLAQENYARGSLATIAREVNKLFLAPAIILFAHGNLVTVAVVNRRQHKRDEAKDVLEKVTLIKGIHVRKPHRAHVEILHDLSVSQLYERTPFTNFVGLHRAWAKALDSSELNKRFFIDVANWFFWASRHAKFPRPSEMRNPDAYQSLSLIRLLTRVIFCWFLKEKNLIPDELFDESRLRQILTNLDPNESTFYRAILQNLFFATLSVPMDERRFIGREFQGKSHDYGKQYVYRFKDYLRHPEQMRDLFGNVPFLNGGLFECLDLTPTKEEPDIKEVRIDGFSSNPKKQAAVPNFLFFGQPHQVDLRKSYGEELRFSEVTVRPLIEIFESYKFTIAENTPVEEEIALDPELLGLVFENLLASFNPETKTTARKQTGAFYTPRVVVDYMVDEALIAHFCEALGDVPEAESRLKELFRYSDEKTSFAPKETAKLLDAIDSGESTIKILDPACGSGAFPMGILHRLVFLLRRLDPGNAAWRERQLARVRSLDVGREAAEKAVKEAFARDEDDYARKLYLIENCIYGVDINPIAVQIAKLRFFISLLVDQETSEKRENRGVLPLPNLETKFVAANTLFALHRRGQTLLVSGAVRGKSAELLRVRHDHFNARHWKDKRVLRRKDKKLREEIAALLRRDQIVPGAEADQLAGWDPYAPNEFANFFDPEWMFALDAARLSKPATTTLRGNLALINEAGGQTELISQERPTESGFDIVIGNPPYVRMEEIKELKSALEEQYYCFTGRADLYVYFYERSLDLLKVGGVLCFISSNKYLRSAYGERLRYFISMVSEVLDLIDFGDAPVFTAIAYPTIIVTRKISETRDKSGLPEPPKDGGLRAERPARANKVRVLTWELGLPIDDFPSVIEKKSFLIPQERLGQQGWRLGNASATKLFEKLSSAGTSLGALLERGIYRGIVTGFNKAFIIDDEMRRQLIREDKKAEEIIKPFIRGRDIQRWQVNNRASWIIYTKRGTAIGRYPSIESYMRSFKSELEARVTKQEWFELQQAQSAYVSIFQRPKIVFPDIAADCQFGFDNSGAYPDCTVFVISTDDKWLVGILNSAVIRYVFPQISPKIRGDFMRFKLAYISQLPIPLRDDPRIAGVEKRAMKVLSLKAADPSAFVGNLEAEIDGLVAHLYGLSESEYRTILDELELPDPARVAAADAYRDAGKGLFK